MLDLAKPSSTSPYVQDTKVQYAWDSTSIGALKRCPRYYQLTIIEGWKGRSQNIHLRFGIEYHSTIQDYEVAKAEGASHDDALKASLRALLIRLKDYPEPPDDPKRSEALKTKSSLVRAVTWYLHHYEEDPAKTVILDNGKPAVELSFRFDPGWDPIREQPYLLCGHLDRIVTYSGDVYLMDHKTTTMTIGPSYYNQFEPDNQMSLYSIAASVIFGSPIRGVIIDATQILTDGAKFGRGFTYRTPGQLEEWLKDLERWIQMAQFYAAEDHWPMNDTSCDKYGGCPFRGICSKDPRARSTFLKGDFIQLPEDERWNPLKTR